MKIRILYFASFREGAGIPEETVDVDEGISIEGLKESLMSAHPGIGGLWDVAVFAVNRAYAEPGRELKEGDEVAVFPPISGG